jgi:hypothetical protein
LRAHIIYARFFVRAVLRRRLLVAPLHLVHLLCLVRLLCLLRLLHLMAY